MVGTGFVGLLDATQARNSREPGVRKYQTETPEAAHLRSSRFRDVSLDMMSPRLKDASQSSVVRHVATLVLSREVLGCVGEAKHRDEERVGRRDGAGVLSVF